MPKYFFFLYQQVQRGEYLHSCKEMYKKEEALGAGQCEKPGKPWEQTMNENELRLNAFKFILYLESLFVKNKMKMKMNLPAGKCSKAPH